MKNPKTTTSEFGLAVEKIVAEGDMTYMDALVHMMEKDNLDEEALAKLVKKSSVIKLKLELESQELNLLKHEKENKLPI